MGWKAEAHRIYEARVLEDSLARLARRLDVAQLPLSKDELRTLAKRTRESFYETEVVRSVSSALEEINNEIGYEEK